MLELVRGVRKVLLERYRIIIVLVLRASVTKIRELIKYEGNSNCLCLFLRILCHKDGSSRGSFFDTIRCCTTEKCLKELYYTYNNNRV